jgi:hypothetical protein
MLNDGQVHSVVFKVSSGYDYIHDNYFPGQQIGEKVFLFKMFVHGNGSGYDFEANIV